MVTRCAIAYFVGILPGRICINQLIAHAFTPCWRWAHSFQILAHVVMAKSARMLRMLALLASVHTIFSNALGALVAATLLMNRRYAASRSAVSTSTPPSSVHFPFTHTGGPLFAHLVALSR